MCLEEEIGLSQVAVKLMIDVRESENLSTFLKEKAVTGNRSTISSSEGPYLREKYYKDACTYCHWNPSIVALFAVNIIVLRTVLRTVGS